MVQELSGSLKTERLLDARSHYMRARDLPQDRTKSLDLILSIINTSYELALHFKNERDAQKYAAELQTLKVTLSAINPHATCVTHPSIVFYAFGGT